MPPFQTIVLALQGFAAVIGIAFGLIKIIKYIHGVAPRSRALMSRVLLAGSPAVFCLCALVAIHWNKPLVAVILFTAAFGAQIADFLNEPQPLSRGSVVGFGIWCCAFTVVIIMTALGNVISQIVSVQGNLIGLVKTLSERLP